MANDLQGILLYLGLTKLKVLKEKTYGVNLSLVKSMH